MAISPSAVLILFSAALLLGGSRIYSQENQDDTGNILIALEKIAPYDNRTHIQPPQHIYPAGIDGTFSDIENESIDLWVEYYSSDANRRWIQNLINRSRLYTGFIREEIIRRYLPPELLFLPALESGYNPKAVSKSGAAGLWQFMTNSIDPYNMSVSEWIDERRDLYKSTTGALDKLYYNYTELNDWLLAIAAYNCGLGCVRRTVEKTGKSNYWEIRSLLPEETQNYIPKFLAISRIFMNPQRYGFSQPENPPVAWSFIPYRGVVNFSLLSREAGIPLETIMEWHPELNTENSPPDSESFILKVPKEYSDTINEVLYNDVFTRGEYYYRKIRHGDTLYSISRSYSIPVDTIMLHNPGLIPRSMLVGDIVLIPKAYSTPPDDRAVLFEVLERYTTYIVKKGDTLWSISRKYNTQPEKLAYWNNLSGNTPIQPGQELKVPVPEEDQ